MKTNTRGSCERWELRKMRHLVFVPFLSCVLSTQHAAAFTLEEAAPDELPIASYRWLAEAYAAKAVIPGPRAGGKKLVWSFHAGYRLVVGMGNRAGPGMSPQIFFERGRIPHIAVRIERQF